MLNWIDTHAHIYLSDFDADRASMLARCEDAGISKIYMPNIDHTSIDAMMNIESRNANCISMMGLHPCSVKKDFEKELYVAEGWLNKRTFAAVGEIGTDLYWDKTFWPQQQEAFKIQVQWAKKFNLPLVIHCRESINETIELLSPFVDGKLTGIFHCFSGNAGQAKEIVGMNFYLGLGGVATFKNGGMDKVLPEVELGRIVLETDSPYLAPVPHRGKRNEPSYIPLIAKKICELKKIPLEKLSEATIQNTHKIFSVNS
ncbi:MAG: putative metal-dependent hydrolase YcfH [Cytophagales bacterium]|jgi:TatD DNase family protein|nr:TatD family hydrolase [Bacteroidota bacterium]MBS1981260.1 TatD family hydrolase [Bacteroidota bacterium]WHZ09279.1 MAG: putative metal-dependent hydrolase YcfH [Cytophagales bacterium]